MNYDKENAIKKCTICLEFQQAQPIGQIVPDGMPGKPLEVIEADIFHLREKHFLYITDYFSKFPIIRQANSLLAECVLACCKFIFAEHGLPKK